jgi:hypothetical protein
MKIKIRGTIIITVVTAILFLAIITAIGNVNAYTNYKGETVSEESYTNREYYCVIMKFERFIPQDIKCKTWVLTEHGEKSIFDYIVKIEPYK